MKNSIELKEMRSDIIAQLENIKDVASTEERDLTQDENNQVDGLLTEVDNLDAKIERAEKLENIKRNAAVVSGVTAKKEDKTLDKFTFQGAARAAYTGKLEGLYKELHQEAINESRYTGTTIKGVGIPSAVLTRANTDTADVNGVDVMSFTDQLEENLVLAAAGSHFYSGINNMKFPVFSGIDSTWVNEAGSSGTVNTNGTTDAVTLTPKKLISVVNMSQESMVQSPSLEAALQRNMAKNMASTLETALLNTADVTNAPASVFADAAAGSTAAFSGATALTLETTVLGNGVQLEGARMAYLMDTDAYAAIKDAAMVSNVSAAYDMRDKTVNGYYAFVSGAVASSGSAGKEHVLFGDFSKLHIAQFGGLDVLFDPYTNSATGVPRLVVTGLFDGDAVQNSTAFANLIEA